MVVILLVVACFLVGPACCDGASKTSSGIQSSNIVETFTGPVFDLHGWVDSGADTNGFNGTGQYTIASPYRGLRRTVGKGTFESLFELKNIQFRGDSSSINLGFVPRDPRVKVILQIKQSGTSLLFRDLDAIPVINQKYDKQALFEKPPKSMKVKITWNEPRKQWRIFYGLNGDEPVNELPQSRIGLYFTNDIDISNEALIFIRYGSLDVDHFEFGPSVKGSAWYQDHPLPRPKIYQSPPEYISGTYYDCEVAPKDTGSFHGAEFRLWVPPGLPRIHGIIVRQHGAGANGKRFAHDLQFQALAAEHKFALMGSFMKAGDSFRDWSQPQNGSGDAFLEALRKLAKDTGHPELESVSWILWGHSAGGQWANQMARIYPNRVLMVISRSGHGSDYTGNDLKIPNLQIIGRREVDTSQHGYHALISRGELRAVAIEPGTGHACTNSRLLTVAFIEAIMDESEKQNQLRLKRSQGWLGDINTLEIAPYKSFNGDKYNAYWLVNEDFARKWKSFVTTGQVPDTTPPPPPTNLTAKVTDPERILLQWTATADVQSGLKRFNVYREGQKIAAVQSQGWNRGDEPDPINCVMAFTDNLGVPTRSLRYEVSSVNFAGLESKKQMCKVNLTR